MGSVLIAARRTFALVNFERCRGIAGGGDPLRSLARLTGLRLRLPAYQLQNTNCEYQLLIDTITLNHRQMRKLCQGLLPTTRIRSNIRHLIATSITTTTTARPENRSSNGTAKPVKVIGRVAMIARSSAKSRIFHAAQTMDQCRAKGSVGR
jgi:hypothetical protein